MNKFNLLWLLFFAATIVSSPHSQTPITADARPEPVEPVEVESFAYEVEVQRPDNGHFWAIGCLPSDAPALLLGPGGERAYRLQDMNGHSAIYAFEAFGEAMEGDIITLGPVTEGQPYLPFSAHPAVLDDPSAITGEVHINDAVFNTPTFELVHDTDFRKRFKSVHDCGDCYVIIWYDVFARSPVVHCAGFIASKDRRELIDLDIVIDFGEPIAFPLERQHGGKLVHHNNRLEGRIDIDRGAVYPIRFTLLCENQPPKPQTDADYANPKFDKVPMDDLSSAANEAGASGRRWFQLTNWDKPWLGIRSEFGNEIAKRIAQTGLDRWQAPSDMYDLRPWALLANGGQGGAQPALSLSWFAPAMVPLQYRPHDVHLWSADDWALRPWLLFDPGTTNPIVNIRQYGGTTSNRQIHESGLSIGGQVYPKFRTNGVVSVPVSNNRSFRTTGDELHASDGPLVTAYALTGDPVVEWILINLRELDFAQRRVSSGWRSNGRGEGRANSSMLMNAQMFGGEALEDTHVHLLKRLDTALSEADTQPSEGAVCLPIDTYVDGRLRCQSPCWVPYQEAQLTYGCWLLWTSTQDKKALAATYRWGLTVATSLYQESDGSWRVPYAVYHVPDGSALPREQLASDTDQVHPSKFPIWWSGSGLKAYLLAAQEMGRPAEHEVYYQRALKAVRWLDKTGTNRIEEIHQGAIGAKLIGF